VLSAAVIATLAAAASSVTKLGLKKLHFSAHFHFCLEIPQKQWISSLNFCIFGGDFWTVFRENIFQTTLKEIFPMG